MSIDPFKKKPVRVEQLKTEAKNHKGIKLYDIDFAIAEHMIDTVMPTVEVMGEKVKIPVIYGNPERWKAIKKDGYLIIEDIPRRIDENIYYEKLKKIKSKFQDITFIECKHTYNFSILSLNHKLLVLRK